MTPSSIYTDGSYLESTHGTWHLEDSPAKARWILEMAGRNPALRTDSICEIGCGAGGIVAELHAKLPASSFVGYEIRPQAHIMSQKFANSRCEFVLGDAFADGRYFDTDFKWRNSRNGRPLIGEFDGLGKYLKDDQLGGLSPGQAVVKEKQREDALRALDGSDFMRWGMQEVRHPHKLRALAELHGVPRVPRTPKRKN